MKSKQLGDLREWAFAHPDHLCNGLCPDEDGVEGSPGMESRDSDCEWCQRIDLFASLEEQFEGGIGLIAAERQRQVASEGWTPEHDDRHRHGLLALAAVSYATPPHYRSMRQSADTDEMVPDTWPEWWPWKPSPEDRVRELVKAGALIAAEIDRLRRGSNPASKLEIDPFPAGDPPLSNPASEVAACR